MPDPSDLTLDAPASPPFTAPDHRYERLMKVADVIQQNPEHFDMGEWVLGDDDAPLWNVKRVRSADLTQCGTTACIAGWAIHLWPSEGEDEEKDLVVVGARILGLSESEADALFFSTFKTAGEAADHLRRMALASEPS